MKSRVLTTSAVLATLLVVGCGGETTSEEPADGLTATEPGSSTEGDAAPESDVNPVDVLRRVPDCNVGAGVESGEPDMNGNLYASCAIQDVEFTEDGTGYTTDVDVTARAVDPAAAQELGYDELISPDDSHKVIAGEGFFLVVTASPAVFGTGALDLEEIAKAVDGQVL